jgi:HD-GYP domain-containing protein (c-di-GMP phosphodiesterase class II)/PAS domain-containing protein
MENPQSVPGRGTPSGWLESLGALTWSVSLDGGGANFGPQWQAFLGAQPAGDWTALVHPDDRATAGDLGQRALRGAVSADLRFRGASGEHRWFLVRATAQQGAEPGWVGLAVDIDDRKRAEEDARERDRHAQALLKLSKALERAHTRTEVCHAAQACMQAATRYRPLWIYLFASDGIHADVYFGNGPAADPSVARLRITGDQMMEEIATATQPVVVVDARTDPRTDKAIVAHLGNRTIINVPILLPGRRLGSVGTGTTGDEGVLPPSPTVCEFLSAMASHLAVALDRVESVLERVAAEARLAESEEHHRQVFENAQEGLFLAEVLDGGQLRQLTANAAFLDASNPLAAWTPGTTLDDTLPNALAQAVHQRQRTVVSTGTMLREEIALDTPTGRRTLDLGLHPVRDATGRLYRLVGITADTTEKRASEAALRRLNRTLRTLSFGNEALVRADSQPELLDRMCHVLVEHGGYAMTWIGLRDGNHGELRTVSWAGRDLGFLEARSAAIAAGCQDHITLPALATHEPRIVHDLESCPPDACRDAALARGFRSAAALPLRNGGKSFGAITLFSMDRDAYDRDELALLVELADDLAYGLHALSVRLDREHGVTRLEAAMDAVTNALGSMVELRDPYTAGHQRRVAALSVAIGARLELDEKRLHGLDVAGRVHDVGKIYVPSEILTRPGKLSHVEFEMVKPHVVAGYEILRPINFDQPIAEMVHQHHEKLDGTGYPRGLKGDAILLEARILTVADVVEAMTNHRPYRPARGLDVALEEVRRGAGTLYDARVVEACLDVFRKDGFVFG